MLSFEYMSDGRIPFKKTQTSLKHAHESVKNLKIIQKLNPRLNSLHYIKKPALFYDQYNSFHLEVAFCDYNDSFS